MTQRRDSRFSVGQESAAYWNAVKEERLVVQRCRVCGHTQFFPRSLCADCSADDLEWQKCQGTGVVHTFAVVHRAPNLRAASRVPYVIALIDLPEGVRMMTNIVDCDPDEVAIGAPVRVVFRPGDDGALLPQFVLVS